MTAGCVIPYIAGILRGETKPQRTSWLIFSLMSTLSAVAQLADGASAGAMLSFGGAIGFTAVFLLSLRHGVGGTGRWDRAALVLMLLGGIGWWVTSNPIVAVLAVIAAESPAIALTAVKAHRDPGSEVLSTWVIDGAAGAVAAFAVGAWIGSELLYPVFHFAANSTVVVALLLGRRRVADVR